MGKDATGEKLTAIITGGATGIGFATAKALAAAGYELILCGRRAPALEQAANELNTSGATVYTVPCDVSVEQNVQAVMQLAADKWGKLDLLFNNAGSGSAVSLEDTTSELWNQTIASCLTGTFLCCRTMLPLLKKAPSPIIINNASVAARQGFPNFTAYSAAKGGIVSFSNALREELRPAGIRVTTVFIGATASPFWDNVAGEWDTSRMMSCDDAAKLIATIAQTRACAALEEFTLMPAGGAL